LYFANSTVNNLKQLCVELPCRFTSLDVGTTMDRSLGAGRALPSMTALNLACCAHQRWAWKFGILAGCNFMDSNP
jgi:hypothetical protein